MTELKFIAKISIDGQDNILLSVRNDNSFKPLIVPHKEFWLRGTISTSYAKDSTS